MAMDAELYAKLSDMEFNMATSSMPDPSWFDQIGSGVDMGQAMMWRGAQSVAEATGMPEDWIVDFARNKNRNIRDSSRVQAQQMWDENDDFNWKGFGDQIGKGIGTLAVAAPAAVAAAFGTKAAIVGGLATSAAMNIGDIGLKAEMAVAEHGGEAYSADLTDLAVGSLAAIPEALLVGKFAKAMTPVATAAGPGLARRMATGAVENAGLSGVTEAAQDLGTTLYAAGITDTFDELEMAEVYKEALAEGMVGAVLGAPFGVGEGIAKNLANTAAQNSVARVSPYSDLMTGETKYAVDVSSPERFKQPSLFNQAYNTLMGTPIAKALGAGDVGGISMAEASPKLRKLMGKLSNTAGSAERRQGVKTMESRTREIQGQLHKHWRSMERLSKKKQEQVFQAHIAQDSSGLQGKELKAYQDMQVLFNDTMPELGVNITEFDRRDPGYFPLIHDVNAKAVRKDEAGFRSKAQHDADVFYADDEAGRDAAYRNIETQIKTWKGQGFTHYGRKDKQLHTMQSALDDDGYMTPQESSAKLKKLHEKAKKRIFEKGKVDSVDKNNPLERSRYLHFVSEDTWSGYRKGDYVGTLGAWSQLSAERIAFVEFFGNDGEGFRTEAMDALQEAADNGYTVRSTDIGNLIDIVNLSQRVPTNRYASTSLGQAMSKGQRSIRSVLNAMLLPLSVLPALAETIAVATIGGTGNTAKAGVNMFGRAMQHMIPTMQRQRPEMIQHLGIGQYEAKQTVASRFTEDVFDLSALESGVIKWSGSAMFSTFLRSLSTNTFMEMMKSDIKTYSDSTSIPQKNKLASKYAELGLNMGQLENWYLDGASNESMYYSDIANAAVNFIDDTVVHPRPIQKPAWASDERLALLAQLKTFSIVFTNTVMKGAWMRMKNAGSTRAQLETAAPIVLGLVAMTSAQIFISAAREILKTGDTEKWEDKDFLEHALGGLAYVGGVSFAIDPFRAGTFGVDPTSVLLGPSASLVNDTAQGITHILSGSQGYAPEDIAGRVIRKTFRSYPVLQPLLKDL